MSEFFTNCPHYHNEGDCPFNVACKHCEYFKKFKKKQWFFRGILLILGVAFVTVQAWGLW